MRMIQILRNTRKELLTTLVISHGQTTSDRRLTERTNESL